MSEAKPRPISAWRPTNLKNFLIGAAHYPEHVDEGYWQRDAERMAAAGFTVARLGEFAWHIFEPTEGRFDFDLFDRAVICLAEHGIRTIMCTPTATPPRWLTKKHPEILRVDANGRPMSHGNRQHADTAHPTFRHHSRLITQAMTDHYRGNANVVGWQTDNELNTSMSTSYSAASLLEFQQYLKEKYHSVKALNHAWGGDFWATAYDGFEDVVLPLPSAPVQPGPGHYQDFHRFLAFSTARFQAEQVKILRTGNPDWYVFHNLGRIDDVDLKGEFSNDLDFLGYDLYPFLHDEGQRLGGVALNQAVSLASFRGYAGNFVIPEHQIGFGAQATLSTIGPEPGELGRMSMSSVAHGADGILYFRWRPAHFGAEIYWNGLINHDDRPSRHLAEVTGFVADLKAIEPKLMGTHVHMDIAVASCDFDNQQSYRGYPMGLPNPQDEAHAVYSHCYRRGYASGFVHPADDLLRLKVLFVPHFVMWREEWTKNITAFVEAGGTVVFTAMTATRDLNSHVLRVTAPGGGLSELCGVTVAELGRAVAPGAEGLAGYDGRRASIYHRKSAPAESASRALHVDFDGQEYPVGHIFEVLDIVAESVETVGRWSSRYVKGRPAISRRRMGRGWAYYVGTYLTDQLASALVEKVARDSAIAPLVPDMPAGLEVTLRQSDQTSLLFVLNTTDTPIALRDLPSGLQLLPQTSSQSGNVNLPGYGYAVIELDGSQFSTNIQI